MGEELHTCTQDHCAEYSSVTDWSSATRIKSGRKYEDGVCGWFMSKSGWWPWQWYHGCQGGYDCVSGTCTDSRRMLGEPCSESYKCHSPNDDTRAVCWIDSKC